jgi:hypothetical protein
MMWCMRRTNIYLDDAQCEALDRLAADEGRSRSELIRDLIDRGLGLTTGSLDDDLAAIEQSFGALQDIDVGTRGHDARSEHLDRVWRATR